MTSALRFWHTLGFAEKLAVSELALDRKWLVWAAWAADVAMTPDQIRARDDANFFMLSPLWGFEVAVVRVPIVEAMADNRQTKIVV
jgi:hypothetical protein